MSASPDSPMTLASAEKVYDRERRHVGYTFRARDPGGRWIDGYYRKDGTSVGFEADAARG